MSEPIEPASAAEAARELARVLLEQADALDLHDLRATTAIENVRVQARVLADAVHERGWGDIFLGIDSYDPDELDDLPLGPDDFDDPADYREMVEGAGLDELDEPLVPENGIRLSYQARYDFVVTDPEAFIAYVRSPETQYVPMQTKLSRDDGLMEYLRHTGSALFAVPPGVRKGGFVGDTLFA